MMNRMDGSVLTQTTHLFNVEAVVAPVYLLTRQNVTLWPISALVSNSFLAGMTREGNFYEAFFRHTCNERA